jgi:hypothetical protein
MPKKVFVLGAGFNQFIKNGFSKVDMQVVENLSLDYSSIVPEELPPPMSRNFFKYSLMRQICSEQSIYGINENVLSYIERLFNRPRASLLTSNFDLELLFSFVESQINDAKDKNDERQLAYLEEIRLNLIIAIGTTFFYLEWRLPPRGMSLLIKFGHLIYRSKSDVITFNYDCLAEWGIERASGESGNAIKSGAPYFNWDKYSAYGIKFTKIRKGGWSGYYDAERGRNIAKAFYEKHYEAEPAVKFIKLHGSYNWYRYSIFKRNPNIKIDNFNEFYRSGQLYVKGKKIPKSLEKDLICFNGDWQYGVLPTWDHYSFAASHSHVLEPVIIPPVLIKEHEFRKEIFQQLWSLAKESLLNCEEIIFIGYSFPDTDFYSKKLFIEVFSENKNIKVTMVNPDGGVAKKFCELVNYKGVINGYSDSGEFIKEFDL